MKILIFPFYFVALCSFTMFSQTDSLGFLSPYHLKTNDLESASITNIVDKKAITVLGGSATGILNRISGVSFVKGSLVSFRGLSPRYSCFSIDGLSAPVTEQNIKAFALGLLPGAAIQELEIYKSGNYINQGEWGGAVVNISTNANLEQDYNKLSVNIGYQHNFTFNTFIQDKDFGTKFGDAFGYAIKTRAITKDIASATEIQNMSRNEAAEQGKHLRNTWGLKESFAAPSSSLGFSFGRILSHNGNRKLSTINAVTYDRTQGGIHYNRARFSGYKYNDEGKVISSELKSYMTDGVFQTNTSIILNSAWNYQLNANQNFNLDLICSNKASNTTLSRYFVGLTNQVEAYGANYGLLAKELFLTRLTGHHGLGTATKIDWTLGGGISNREEPDLRRVGAQRNLNQPEASFLLVIPESSKADNGARFSSDLKDLSYAGRLDLSHDFIKEVFQLKGGVISEYIHRDFNARVITSAKDDFTTTELRFVEAQNLDTVFAPEHYGANGYYIVDGTTSYDSYEGKSVLAGGYTGLNYTFHQRFLAAVGFRVEHFQQDLISGDKDTDAKNSSTNILPYVSLNYNLTPQLAIKVGYSMSLNRPAFRELSPFTFYDFDYRSDIQGNSDLKSAKLSNFDLHALKTFNRNAYVSLGLFYKNISNPIEMIYIIRSESPLFSFDNAKKAIVGGVELEFSTYLSKVENSFLGRTLCNGNLSYIYSEIKLGEDTNEVASNRPLQGQTPTIITAGLTHLCFQNKAQISVGYKYLGQSLYSVGDGQETFPWYSKPRHLLNAGASYKMTSNLKLNLTAQNILNTPDILIEDANINKKIGDAVDKEVQKGLTYQTFNLTMVYSF